MVGQLEKMSFKTFIKNWICPPGYIDLFSNFHENKINHSNTHVSILKKNKELYLKHSGDRCFIVCNGPSINTLDLTILKDEIVFTVSNGYLHKDFKIIKPKYHCVPKIHSSFNGQFIKTWFKEMDSYIQSASVFLSLTEEKIVEEYNLFSNRKKYYLSFESIMENQKEGLLIDIERPIPSIQSVPIMAIIIAMYTGCKKIILVGVEHDDFITGDYRYFYETSELHHKSVLQDISLYHNKQGNYINPRYDQLHSLARLWRQYRVLKEIAINNNVEIINATGSGVLDEFPCVGFDELF